MKKITILAVFLLALFIFVNVNAETSTTSDKDPAAGFAIVFNILGAILVFGILLFKPIMIAIQIAKAHAEERKKKENET